MSINPSCQVEIERLLDHWRQRSFRAGNHCFIFARDWIRRCGRQDVLSSIYCHARPYGGLRAFQNSDEGLSAIVERVVADCALTVNDEPQTGDVAILGANRVAYMGVCVAGRFVAFPSDLGVSIFKIKPALAVSLVAR